MAALAVAKPLAPAPPHAGGPERRRVRARLRPRRLHASHRPVAPAPGGPPARHRRAIVMARAEAARGRFEAAYQGFRKVLAREPRNTDALYYLTILGAVLAQARIRPAARAGAGFGPRPSAPRRPVPAQERPADAEAEYKAAAARRSRIARAADRARRPRRGISRGSRRHSTTTSARVKVAPRNYDALYGLGVAHSYQREYAPAIAAFRERPRRRPVVGGRAPRPRPRAPPVGPGGGGRPRAREGGGAGAADDAGALPPRPRVHRAGPRRRKRPRCSRGSRRSRRDRRSRSRRRGRPRIRSARPRRPRRCPRPTDPRRK